jgi:hypothetical protein
METNEKLTRPAEINKKTVQSAIDKEGLVLILAGEHKDPWFVPTKILGDKVKVRDKDGKEFEFNISDIQTMLIEENENMMQPKKRKYFQGTKKLKNLKMFEEFDINEVEAEAIASRKLRVPAKFKADIILAANLAEELAEVTEKQKQLAKQLSLVEEGAGGIIETMQRYGSNALKIENIIAELEKKPGKETTSWKGVSEALEKLIPKMHEAIEKIHKANEHPAVEKLVMKYSIEKKKVDESLKDDVKKTWDTIKGWFTSFARSIKELLPKFEDAAAEFEAAAKKLGISPEVVDEVKSRLAEE